jgi:hypothetical protein
MLLNPRGICEMRAIQKYCKERSFMKRALMCSPFIFLLFFMSLNAHADLISQPPNTTWFYAYTSNANVGYDQDNNPYDNTSREAGEFTLPSASTITAIKWWGFDVGGGWSGASAFTLTFYSAFSVAGDGTVNAGNPILTTSPITLTSADPDSYYSSFFPPPDYPAQSVWTYLATGLNVPLPAGTYCLSIFDTNTGSPNWGWMMSDTGTSYQQAQAWGGGWSQQPYNAAFELTYAQVPIPAAGWLLASGLVALVAIRRRRR